MYKCCGNKISYLSNLCFFAVLKFLLGLNHRVQFEKGQIKTIDRYS